MMLAQLARPKRNNDDDGFTLIELLIVVIIIGILAAVAIPIYIGVQNQAKDSNVRSDVINFKTASLSILTSTNAPVASSKTTWSTSGTAFTSTLTAAGATMGSSTTSISYYPAASGSFCILGISSTGNSFAATDSLGATKGSCTTSGTYSTAVVTAAP